MLAEKNQCTGCGSCVAACVQNCIRMTVDAEGFRYPRIDETACIRCRKCEKSCPVLMASASAKQSAAAVAAQNADEAVRKNSSSGGVFAALAELVLENGGAVCAAGYDADFWVVHRIVCHRQEIPQLQGAKYAQSQAEHCYPEILELLRQGTPVLFVGTPCQVAGLDAFLGKKYDNLILADMICHGVPSPMVWADYLSERRRLDAGGAEIAAVNLRSKSTGWSRYKYSVEIRYRNGQVYDVSQGSDLFLQGFVRNLYLRPSCGDCSFKGDARRSDLTLGDYWGIWDQHPDFDDDRGTSLLLIHTETGHAAWQHIKPKFNSIDVNVSDALSQNPSATVSSVPHPKRGAFFEAYIGEDVIERIRRMLQEAPCGKENLMQRMKRKLTAVLRRS